MDSYKLKYGVTYANIVGDRFSLEIYQKSEFDFVAQKTAGSVIFTKGNVDDVFEPLRATSITINLEASQSNLLEDFSAFNEFDFKVKFYRNDLQIFEGWINPDGYFQDWVNDKWEISMTAVDGFGTLKNLEFSDKGFERLTPLGDLVAITYAPREFNYLYASLKRLGYELPFVLADDINVELGVNPEWVDVKKRIIDREVFINNNGTFSDCETVIKDILQKYNLTITQENIEGRLVWYIARVAYANYTNEQKINRQYNTVIEVSEGIAEVLLQQFNFANGNPKERVVYSDINSSEGDVIHCNENQQITFKPALQNFRFESKWNGLRNFFGSIEDTWTAIPPHPNDFYFINPDGMNFGLIVPVNDVPVFQSNYVTQQTDADGVDFSFDWNSFLFTAGTSGTIIRFTIEVDRPSGILYYNQDDEIWESTPSFIEVGIQNQTTVGATISGTVTVSLPPLEFEIGTKYKVVFYKPTVNFDGGFQVVGRMIIEKTYFYFNAQRFGNGKTHDSTQPQKRSTFLNNPVTVINTNEPNAIFQNNLYRLASAPEQVTGLVPMNEWKATNTPTFADLLELTGRERIRVKANPQRVFSGDVFGFVPYSSVIKYDGINGNFVPLAYNYITSENVIQLEAVQTFNENVEIQHEKKFTFENERNILIKEL